MTRIVLISDTHRKHDQVKVPDGDILIHAGDIGCEDHFRHLAFFHYWFGQLPHKHKIVIPGNHDVWIEKNQQYCKDSFTNGHLLIDEALTVEGLKVWGSPWQPEFCNWAWNLPRGKALERVWSLIPDDTDILITHGPPRNILDKCIIGSKREGCDALRERVFEIRPKIHVFGHIHEGYGEHHEKGVHFINASVCDFHYKPCNPPIVVDYHKS
jgi:predicted phosphohydrolase